MCCKLIEIGKIRIIYLPIKCQSVSSHMSAVKPRGIIIGEHKRA